MKELKTHKHTEQTPMSHFKIVDLKAFEIIFNFIEKLFTEKIIKVQGYSTTFIEKYRRRGYSSQPGDCAKYVQQRFKQDDLSAVNLCD